MSKVRLILRGRDTKLVLRTLHKAGGRMERDMLRDSLGFTRDTLNVALQRLKIRGALGKTADHVWLLPAGTLWCEKNTAEMDEPVIQQKGVSMVANAIKKSPTSVFNLASKL